MGSKKKAWLEYLRSFAATGSDETIEKRVLIVEFLEELELKPSEIQIIVWSYLDNRSYTQIAHDLKIKHSVTKARHLEALDDVRNRVLLTMTKEELDQQSHTVRIFLHHIFNS
jgi:hypothetical protein